MNYACGLSFRNTHHDTDEGNAPVMVHVNFTESPSSAVTVGFGTTFEISKDKKDCVKDD